jgi:hypothetical protein
MCLLQTDSAKRPKGEKIRDNVAPKRVCEPGRANGSVKSRGRIRITVLTSGRVNWPGRAKIRAIGSSIGRRSPAIVSETGDDFF